MPAVSDIRAAMPEWQIDWVCEEALAGIPQLHSGVARVIPCAIRTWRRRWWSKQSRREIARFKKTLRETSYDVVLDLQGLLKSAWITWHARGKRHGYTWGSAREPLATLAYDVRHPVAWDQHAITRNRQLAAEALGYRVDGAPRYGVKVGDGKHTVGAPCMVALHATSRTDKLWPEADWRRLLAAQSARGLRIILPWGTPLERERSERLAAGIAGAIVPARMAPRELAILFSTARIVVGVDTGLLHLAVATGARALALFGPTNPKLTGVQGELALACNLGGNGEMPDVDQVLSTIEQLLAEGDGTLVVQATSA